MDFDHTTARPVFENGQSVEELRLLFLGELPIKRDSYFIPVGFSGGEIKNAVSEGFVLFHVGWFKTFCAPR